MSSRALIPTAIFSSFSTAESTSGQGKGSISTEAQTQSRSQGHRLWEQKCEIVRSCCSPGPRHIAPSCLDRIQAPEQQQQQQQHPPRGMQKVSSPCQLLPGAVLAPALPPASPELSLSQACGYFPTSAGFPPLPFPEKLICTSLPEGSASSCSPAAYLMLRDPTSRKTTSPPSLETAEFHFSSSSFLSDKGSNQSRYASEQSAAFPEGLGELYGGPEHSHFTASSLGPETSLLCKLRPRRS